MGGEEDRRGKNDAEEPNTPGNDETQSQQAKKGPRVREPSWTKINDWSTEKDGVRTNHSVPAATGRCLWRPAGSWVSSPVSLCEPFWHRLSRRQAPSHAPSEPANPSFLLCSLCILTCSLLPCQMHSSQLSCLLTKCRVPLVETADLLMSDIKETQTTDMYSGAAFPKSTRMKTRSRGKTQRTKKVKKALSTAKDVIQPSPSGLQGSF